MSYGYLVGLLWGMEPIQEIMGVHWNLLKIPKKRWKGLLNSKRPSLHCIFQDEAATWLVPWL